MNHQTSTRALYAGLCTLLIGAIGALAHAGADTDATDLFRHATQSGGFFSISYGYAVFPTIGKGGLGVGAAHGSGHVYAQGVRIGRVSMNQISVGAQAGGEAYSEIIFFRDRAALEDFTSGNFEFSADAGVVAVTAAADVSIGTAGADAAASATENDAATIGGYRHGMAIFTIAKGGLMYHATVAGQKFSYWPASHG
jgi:Las17-binding protein actin regulator